MTPLPDAIQEITVPETFTPTQLANALECRLRALFSSRGAAIPRLSSGPAAERGNVFHLLLERAAKGLIPNQANPRAAVSEDLKRILAEAEARLVSIPHSKRFAKLSQTLPLVDWHNATAKILESAERLLIESSVSLTTDRAQGASRFSYTHLRGFGKWCEVTIAASKLRLRGRMDVVELRPANRVVVRDYKTGRIYDSNGQLSSRVALQLRLYGIAILSLDPESRVSLVLSDGSEDTAVPFDSESALDTQAWLEQLLTDFPTNDTLPTLPLANPGSACVMCSHRHVCPAYIASAPIWWRTGAPTQSMPLDIWGDISSIEEVNDSISLELKDPSGRRIRIQRLDPRRALVHTMHVGQKVWLFGLSSNTKGAIGGRSLGPRNFYEIPDDSSERRAWSLEVFTSDPIRV